MAVATNTTTQKPGFQTSREFGRAPRTPWILAGIFGVVAILAIVFAFMATGDSEPTAAEEATALEELLAQERAVLDFYFAESDSSTYIAMYATDDVTYIDPNSGGILRDRAAKDYLQGFTGLIPPFTYEITDATVNLSGETAVFTFNVNMFSDGEPVGAWNTTEIHQRADGGWEMIHAHWSNPAPPPEG
jgi:ketosteroid isomerase-like protein